MNTIYVNEIEYKQCFINNIKNFPDEMKTSLDNNVFVWGNELNLNYPDKDKTSHIPDLLTVDEEGLVWLIEAKLEYNTELSGKIWGKQIARYRKALMSLAWNEIHRATKRFLAGKNRNKPQIDIPKHCDSLEEAINLWQKSIGREKVKASKVVDMIADSLKTGNFGICVMADIFFEPVLEGSDGFEHKGELAYLIVNSTNEDQMIYKLIRDSKIKSPTAYRDYKTLGYKEFDRKNIINITSKNDFYNSLCIECQSIFNEVIVPGFTDLNFKYKFEIRNKSFKAMFPVNGKHIPLIMAGHPSADSMSGGRKYLVKGSFALKFDLYFAELKKMPNTKKIIDRYSEEFYNLGWRFPKSYFSKHSTKEFNDADYQLWSSRMKYFNPKKGWRCVTGEDEEKDKLSLFIQKFDDFLNDLNTTLGKTSNIIGTSKTKYIK